jgi:hypothetical protein
MRSSQIGLDSREPGSAMRHDDEGTAAPAALGVELSKSYGKGDVAVHGLCDNRV